MSRGLNKVMIIGHLGKDPEMRITPSGRSVTTFSVATSRTWNTSNGERKSETEWFNVVYWGSLAEICDQFLTKGQQVYIEGRLQTRKWDGEDGTQRISVEIVAKEMVMLGDRKKKHSEIETNPNEETLAIGTYPETDTEEFPF